MRLGEHGLHDHRARRATLCDRRSLPYFGSVNYLETPPSAGALTVPLIMSGAVLTFYAFVGFEDLLNLAEEVKNPQRNMPWGIILAVAAVTVIYVLVSIAAISVVAYADLRTRRRALSLAQITRVAAPWLPHHVYTGITLFAVANTALMNFIMGSRLIYGMSRQGLLPPVLGLVHNTRRTPHVAILTLAAIVSILAFSGDISELACHEPLAASRFRAHEHRADVLKLRKGEAAGRFEVPLLVPFLGCLICGLNCLARNDRRRRNACAAHRSDPDRINCRALLRRSPS